MGFLVTNHAAYPHGQANLYCKYDDDDDQNYIARIALKRLDVPEGPDGKVTLFFIDGDQSSDRTFIVQDCTVQGVKLESDILFGMKTVAESNTEESPLEEISNKAFDGSDDLGDLHSTFYFHVSNMPSRASSNYASRNISNPRRPHAPESAGTTSGRPGEGFGICDRYSGEPQ